MQKTTGIALVISILSQLVISIMLVLTYETWHLKGSSLDLFWRIYPVSVGFVGILIPLLCLRFTSKWYYGLTSSIITGFIVLLGFVLLTYFLMRKPDARATIFLPMVAGIVEAIYFTGNLVGTIPAYILRTKRQTV